MNRAQDALDRAAEWIVRQEEADWSDKDQAEFDAWFHVSEGNKAAYWRLKHSWKAADRIKALGPNLTHTSCIGRRSTYWWKGAAVAASLIIVTGSAFYIWPGPSSRSVSGTRAATEESRFETQVGGHKRINLPDGSVIELNTASAVRVAISQKARMVLLERGEAYFQVAHAQNRPFVIQSRDHVITVLGTKFAVRQDAEKTTVSVFSGRVQLAGSGAAKANRLAILTRGDIAVAKGSSTLVTTFPLQELEDRLSWRSAMLRFDGISLETAASELNRYNRKQLVISDPEVAAMRIGGSFPATDPDAFIRLMRDAYDLKAEIDGNIVKISR